MFQKHCFMYIPGDLLFCSCSKVPMHFFLVNSNNYNTQTIPIWHFIFWFDDGSKQYHEKLANGATSQKILPNVRPKTSKVLLSTIFSAHDIPLTYLQLGIVPQTTFLYTLSVTSFSTYRQYKGKQHPPSLQLVLRTASNCNLER